MFHQLPTSLVRIPNRKKFHQHHESKIRTRLAANEKCLECYPIRRPFLETAFGKAPPEIREIIFKEVLTVGSISPLKDGISVPVARPHFGPQAQLIGCPAGPASCLALLQTCRQISHEASLLFYAVNTFYLSSPQDMLSFLRHLGPVRCGQVGSLHLEDVLVKVPMFSQSHLDRLRSQRLHSEDILARFSTMSRVSIHPDTEAAVRLLNKRGNLQKIYLDMRPSQTLEYIKLCGYITGCKNSEVVFASPTRWSVMRPSTARETRSWFLTSFSNEMKKPLRDRRYYAYWEGDEKYHVEVDIFPALPQGRTAGTEYDRLMNAETRDGSSVDAAMDGLSIA